MAQLRALPNSGGTVRSEIAFAEHELVKIGQFLECSESLGSTAGGIESIHTTNARVFLQPGKNGIGNRFELGRNSGVRREMRIESRLPTQLGNIVHCSFFFTRWRIGGEHGHSAEENEEQGNSHGNSCFCRTAWGLGCQSPGIHYNIARWDRQERPNEAWQTLK